MGSPDHTVALTSEQVRDIAERLSRLRHDVNNHLSLVVAAAEMIQHKPEMGPQLLPTLLSQPQKISDRVQGFSEFLEGTLGITHDEEFSSQAAQEAPPA
jgi:hypothetical protein